MVRKILYFISHMMLISNFSILSAHEDSNANRSSDHHGGDAETLTGRYRGFIFPDQKDYRIPVQIDFFKAQNDSEYTHLEALLKVSLGGFDSHEYVSQFYNEVSYSWHHKTITLNGDDWDLLITSLKMVDGALEGTIKSASGHKEGHIQLEKIKETSSGHNSPGMQGVQKTPVPVLQNLSGEYRGICDGREKILQLEAGKWFEAVAGSMNPFYGYKISGRMGEKSGMCGNFQSFCATNNFSDGIFNPYTGDLKLRGYPKNLRMTVHAGKIDFNGCNLRKVSTLANPKIVKNKSRNPVFTIDRSQSEPLSQIPELEELDGHFNGYLFHSEHGIYQPLEIDIKSSRYNDRPGRPEIIHFYSFAWLKFSDQVQNDKNDFITLDFKEREFLHTTPDMIWDTGRDVKLQITSWNKDLIEGLWISQSYGVVGPFAVSRNSGQISPPASSDISGVTFGQFRNQSWNLDLTAFEDRDPEEEAIFFPLHMHGTAEVPGLTEVKSVESGVFDFYSGAVTFELSDARVVLGWVKPGMLELMIPPRPMWGIKISESSTQKFIR